MPQRQQLDVAIELIAATDDQAKRHAEREIDESKGHPRILPTGNNRSCKAELE